MKRLFLVAFWGYGAVLWLLDLLNLMFKGKTPDHISIGVALFVTFCFLAKLALEALNG